VPSFHFPLTVVSLAAVAAVTGLPLATPLAQTPASGYKESISGTLVTFDMVAVPGGTTVVDGVTVTVAPFLIGRTEVTWDLYDVYAHALDTAGAAGAADATARPSRPYGAPDYGWGHAGYPAISVARPAADAFCAWLSAKTGRTYRLPTEAEWVHAATLAAGTATTPAMREAMTWHRDNAKGTTHPVGTLKPDALGLSDLFGNAAEWVISADGKRVTRGGSFRDALADTGPAARAEQDSTWNERDPQLPKSRWWLSDGPFVGFRVVSDAK
jgi:formylglycine-generating enzyme required for sulfatase activity